VADSRPALVRRRRSRRQTAKYASIRQKQASTNSLLMNQLVVQMVHSGSGRNRANLVTTIAISIAETPSASA
jgi:hypothetical protein